MWKLIANNEVSTGEVPNVTFSFSQKKQIDRGISSTVPTVTIWERSIEDGSTSAICTIILGSLASTASGLSIEGYVTVEEPTIESQVKDAPKIIKTGDQILQLVFAESELISE